MEWLYLLGEEHRIAGISQFVERPVVAKTEKPILTSFISSNYEKIESIKPDLIIGYSDIQKDIARDLVERGYNVFISNHRSLNDVLNYLFLLGSMVGKGELALELISGYRKKMEDFATKVQKRVRVYLEEWDEPRISAIRYFSEIVELCGGDNIFKDKASGFLAKDRFVDDDDVIKGNPEKILACWCGKKVRIDQIRNRDGWENILAIRNNEIYELDPAVFLQPGPALFEQGLDNIFGLLNG